ncbi:MAG: hypothetical protein ACQEXJ_11965 [Myxococcota bacterium]
MNSYESTSRRKSGDESRAAEPGAVPAGGPQRGRLRAASYEEGAAMLAPEGAVQREASPEGEGAKDAEEEEKARLEAVKATWEQSLGNWLGGKLFEVVQEHTSLEALLGYAQDGVSAAAEELPGLIEPTKEGAAGGLMDEASEAEAVQKLVTALMPKLEEAANGWLEGEDGQAVLKDVSGWVEEHPRTIAISLGTAAIGAAVAAYLSNMDIPAVEQEFDLGGGWTAGASVDPGQIQNLVVQAASASVAYEAEGLSASVTGEYDRGEPTTVTAAAGVERKMDEGEVTGEGTVSIDDTGKTVVTLDGGLTSKVRGTPLEVAAGVSDTRGGEAEPATKVNGRIVLGEEGERQTVEGEYDPGDESFSFGLSREDLEGRLSTSHELSRNAEGDMTRSTAATLQADERNTVGMRQQAGPEGEGGRLSWAMAAPEGGGLSAHAAAGAGTLEGAEAGVAWTEEDLKAELDVAMSEGTTTLDVGGEYEKNNWTAEGEATLNLSERRIQSMAASLGWKDPEQFRGFLVDYKANWMAEHQQMSHEVDTVLEYAVGRVSGRLSGGLDLRGNTLMGNRANLLMGYDVNDDWKALGGVGYTGERVTETGSMEGRMNLEAGVQYKNVAVTATYEPESEAWGVGLRIPLGR